MLTSHSGNSCGAAPGPCYQARLPVVRNLLYCLQCCIVKLASQAQASGGGMSPEPIAWSVSDDPFSLAAPSTANSTPPPEISRAEARRCLRHCMHSCATIPLRDAKIAGSAALRRLCHVTHYA